MSPPRHITLLATVASVGLAGMAAADGHIAPAGPCAMADTPGFAAPIQQLLSPQDVAAAGGLDSPATPGSPAFDLRQACDALDTCGTPPVTINGAGVESIPPTNPPGPGLPPGE